MAINDAIALALKNFNGALNDKLYAFWKALAAGYLSGGGVVGVKAPGVLAQVATPSSITGTVAETPLATISIPAGVMSANSVLRITTLWSMTNNANAKTLTWRLGGTSIGASSVPSFASNRHQIEVRNRNATNSQVVQGGNSAGGWGASTSANLILAIDTSVSQNLTLNATLGNTADTITLEGYTIEILNP